MKEKSFPRTIKKLAIVGRDIDAWLTALMLKQTFLDAEQNIEIELIELPSLLTEHDFYSVLPSHKFLHKMLGANEDILLNASKAHVCYGQRFSGWSGAGTPFIHAYDRFGVDLNGINFYQYWLKATNEGLRISLEDFNLGAVAAKNGRRIVLDDSSSSFSKATYGLHLCAVRYVRAIAKAALVLGLKHRQSHIKKVNVAENKIASIVLSNDVEISADFFIDATGTDASLIKQLEQDNIESWASWLPCDRTIVSSAQNLDPKPGFSQIYAFNEGWAGFYPLADRTGVSISYSSKHTNTKNVIEKVITISGLKFSSIVEAKITPGQRKQHWIGNCLAIGTSAISLEPLDAVQLHGLQLGISLLREFFPNDATDMCEAESYNKKISSFAQNIRDFQVAHYYLNRRFGENFWDTVRNTTPPKSLLSKLRLFEERGLIAIQEDETFFDENWTSIFVGHGIKTKTFDPFVNKMSSESLKENFLHILNQIKNEIEAMPTLQEPFEWTTR